MLISYKQWRESTAFTRWRDGWLKGLYPPRADFASHSTPSPEAWEKGEKALLKPKKKSKKKKGCK